MERERDADGLLCRDGLCGPPKDGRELGDAGHHHHHHHHQLSCLHTGVTGGFILSCHPSLSGPEEWAGVHQAEVGSGQFLRWWPGTLHQLQQERQAEPLLPVSRAASRPKTSLEAEKWEMPPVGRPETCPSEDPSTIFLNFPCFRAMSYAPNAIVVCYVNNCK